jgi:hypothetical protein
MTISEIVATSSYKDTKKEIETHTRTLNSFQYKKNYQFSEQMLLVNGFLVDFLFIFNVFLILSLYRNKQKKIYNEKKIFYHPYYCIPNKK